MAVFGLLGGDKSKTIIESSQKIKTVVIDGNIEIDATLSANHEMTSMVTSNPIEEGADINDHIEIKNRKITLDCVITDNPLEYELSSGGNAKKAYYALRSIWSNKKVFKITVGFDTYDPCVITTFSIPESIENGNALRFNMALEELNIVSPDATIISAESINLGSMQASS